MANRPQGELLTSFGWKKRLANMAEENLHYSQVKRWPSSKLRRTAGGKGCSKECLTSDLSKSGTPSKKNNCTVKVCLFFWKISSSKSFCGRQHTHYDFVRPATHTHNGFVRPATHTLSVCAAGNNTATVPAVGERLNLKFVRSGNTPLGVPRDGLFLDLGVDLPGMK